MESRSAYVIKMTDTVRPFHMPGILQTGRVPAGMVSVEFYKALEFVAVLPRARAGRCL
jgi:hypothetical protein